MACGLCLGAAGRPAAAQTPVSAPRGVVTAVEVQEPLRIDGRLDEPLYTTPPSTQFVQTEPTAGRPFSEKTELWVGFDRRNVYIAWRCWESHPERVIGSELRRDSNLIVTANDNVAFALDPFHDRRNSVLFVVGPDGGRVDGQVVGERQWTPDWNPVWTLKTSRFEGGWIVEAAIPFRSLRYAPGSDRPWGFIARRMSRWKNEIAYTSPVPNGSGIASVMWSSFYGDLVGITSPTSGKNIEVKPYVTGSLVTDRAAATRRQNDPGGDLGVDVKYGIRENLTADLTWNTDFAQVEVDEQQVNLTRFNLFFPEKREFFLENQGQFAFGGAGGAGTGSTDVPTLFYSRRIGLDDGAPVPILGGGRVTGRGAGFEFGAIQIRTDRGDSARLQPTDFSVLRAKRDILGKSSLGVLATRRSVAPGRPAPGLTYGADARFAFGQNLTGNAFWAATDTAGVTAGQQSYRAQLDYNADRYAVQVERLAVDASFNPDIGFVRRRDMEKSYAFLRFSPRPKRGPVRKYAWSTAVDHIENRRGRLESRRLDGDFSVEFQNSDKLLVGITDQYEFLPQAFRIAQGVTLPSEGYGFRFYRAGVDFGQHRRLFGQLRVERGEFYSGTQTTVALRAARITFSPRLAVEPTASVNAVDLREGRFTTRLAGARVTFTATPRMFASALIQYNSSAASVSSNVRFRWEYLPGSELFVVYNDQRTTTAAQGFPDLVNRSIILKINRLFRF
jgi:hypothetical protein